MRTFTSYGPTRHNNYSVPRTAIVEQCIAQLVGDSLDPDGSGHFFTIWAPRQTGKTWLMGRAVDEIKKRYGDRFMVGWISIQELGDFSEDDLDYVLRKMPILFRNGLKVTLPRTHDWNEFSELFSRANPHFDRPLILLIDEFDKLPRAAIDKLVSVFRGIYLHRDVYWLHGLALIGVRSVLGVDSRTGSPFNVPRSLHVPNLTHDEVLEMFDQYQHESGQQIQPEVVEKVFEVTLGQPGLVGWFGELLTETHNPGKGQTLDLNVWKWVYLRAQRTEPNNTILNLVIKARTQHTDRIIDVFSKSDVPFSLDEWWCNYLHMNGILAPKEALDNRGEAIVYCRFTCPFIQERLYNALINTTVGDGLGGFPLDPLDLLEDVFTESGLKIPPLLGRYKAFLQRIQVKGILPWKGQARRSTDEQVLEAVGHFHLYAWLQRAIGSRCTVCPQFPTGNGTVDLVLFWEQVKAVIEVKSFVDRYQLTTGRQQAARYARSLGLTDCTLAVFVPFQEEDVLTKLSSVDLEDDVTVTTVAIGWG